MKKTISINGEHSEICKIKLEIIFTEGETYENNKELLKSPLRSLIRQIENFIEIGKLEDVEFKKQFDN